MLKYKINVYDALKRKGFTTYKAQKTRLISQDGLKKIKEENTDLTLKTINNICMILDLQPKDILEYVETEEDRKKFEKM